MTPSLIKTAAFIAASTALLGSPPASAEDYPSRAITIVVPYVPGGNIDTTARLVGRAMGEVLRQPVE